MRLWRRHKVRVKGRDARCRCGWLFEASTATHAKETARNHMAAYRPLPRHR